MKKTYFLLLLLINMCFRVFTEEVVITNYSGRKFKNFPLFFSYDFKSPNLQLITDEGEEYHVQKTMNGGYFLLDIEPWQRKSFILKENKINISEGVFFSKEDPLGWESEIVGFRMYDGKIDLFGKKKPCFFIKMIKEDKSIDIHHPTNPFGADILEKVAESLVGCGGLCYKEGDKFYNFGQPKKIEILENGPIVCSFKLSWENGLVATFRIFAKNRYTTVEIQNKTKKEIYTGIRILEEEKFYKDIKIICSWGEQKGSSMKGIGQGIILLNSNIKEIIDFSGNHLIKIPDNGKYLILCGWEMEGIKNYDEWLKICKNIKEDMHSLLLIKTKKEKITKDEVKEFMKNLVKFVENYHLKKDEKSQQFGMIYEYVNTCKIGELGQWIQGEGLDTMHDGAWFAVSLCQAYRATNDKYYLDFLLNYSIPFYTKVLCNSDILFKDGLDENKVFKASKFGKEWKYMGNKGFCPYWWDDGASVSIDMSATHNHVAECVDYFVLNNKQNPENRLWGFSLGCSNHMAQDLAVMLIEAYLLTKKEEILLSAKYLQEDRSQRGFPTIPVILASASFQNQNLLEKIWSGYRGDLIENEPLGVYYDSLYNYEENKIYASPGFTDNEEYYFYSILIKNKGELSEKDAFKIIYSAFTNPFLYKYWFDLYESDEGLNRFDFSSISIKNGKFISYRSDIKGGMFLGSRMGPQNLKLIGWALQLLEKFPGVWEKRYKEKFKDDFLVKFKDDFKIDCLKENSYSPIYSEDGNNIYFGVDRKNLYIFIEKTKPIEFKIYSKGEKKGNWINVKINNEIEILNFKGEKIIYDYLVKDNKIEIKIPFQVCKNQKDFLNCVEHGRYSIEIGNRVFNFYTMTEEKDLKDYLLNSLEEGIIVWKKIFEKKGYIPTGIGTSGFGFGYLWEDLSDTGGYAHLLGACSQYLYYIEGKKYWEDLKINEFFR